MEANENKQEILDKRYMRMAAIPFGLKTPIATGEK